MDRESFLLERETLQKRMAFRRQEATAAIEERQHATIPRLIRTGASLLFGMGTPQGESAGWVSSLIWTIAAPALMGALRKGGDTLIQRLIHSVFPSDSSK